MAPFKAPSPLEALHSGVAFDGANIWVTNSGSNTVSKLWTSAVLSPWFSVG